MIKIFFILNITIYILFTLNNLKKKIYLDFIENKITNQLLTLILMLLLILVLNNNIIYILIILVCSTKNTISFIIRILMLQTYYYYFLKYSLLRNNVLKLYFSYCDMGIKLVVGSKKKLFVLRVMVYIFIIYALPFYVFFIFYVLIQLKNYYVYVLDYVCDSFSSNYYFEEDIFLTDSGKFKIKQYKNNLIYGLEKNNTSLKYFIDYIHNEN